MNLKSFDHPLHVVVIGASGGLGRAFVETLAGDDAVAAVHAFSRRATAGEDAKITSNFIDLNEEATVADAAASLPSQTPAALVLVATGLLHDDAVQPEKTWRDIDPDAMRRAFAVNTIGPALVAKHFLPRLPRDRKSVLAVLSARIGSIGDNRLGGWVSYRASKAALNMVVRTLGIELARRNPQAIIAGLHPGTVDTALSRPFQGNVPADKLFTPHDAAQKLLRVVDGLGPDDSGGLFAWDGSTIPF